MNDKSITERLREYFESSTPEELKADMEKFFPKDNTPKGWVSIHEYLPKCYVTEQFLENGFNIVLVKTSEGEEFEMQYSDPETWKMTALDLNVIEWFNN